MSLSPTGTLSSLEAAQDATHQARKAVTNARRRSQALEEKLRMLKQEYEECEIELRVARTVEEGTYILFTQAISKNFTSAFVLALPRELRDQVYSYLWDDEDIIRQTKRSVREYAWSYRMPEFCAPPYVQPDHVGRVVAEELALSIYKRAFGPKLHVTVSAGHIHKFLAANPLRSSLKPADCIKALDIEWYPNEYSDEGVARSYRDLANYKFPHPVSVKLILGKLVDVIDRKSPSMALESQLSVFKPAYDALTNRHCPVRIESLSGHGAEVEMIARS